MKKRIITALILILNSGLIIADTIVWSGSIVINEDMYFTDQQTLLIQPGTIITANGPYKIEVRGNVIAYGKQELPILFTALDTIGLLDTSTVIGGWNGIHLLNNFEGNAYFSNCRFEYGKANIPGSWYGTQGQLDTIRGNQGGAIRLYKYGNATFDSCIFFGNFARSHGGGIYQHDVDSIIISNCIFEQNKVLANGGGIFTSRKQYLKICKSTFKLNYAWSVTQDSSIFSHGSAIYMDAFTPNPINDIYDNYFFNNKSLSCIADFTEASVIVNNLFTNNYNMDVLIFTRDESSHIVLNNTIANNYYKSGIPGVHNFSQDLLFYNNILWNNFSDNYSNEDLALKSYNYPPADVQYCLVWDGRIIGTNIITDDPVFIDPAPYFGLGSNGWEYDWSLQNSSPAINAGTPDTINLNIPGFDIAGNPRIYGFRIDMGAYENQIIVGVHDNVAYSSNISILPNPFINDFTISQGKSTVIKSIKVIDNSGAIIKSINKFNLEKDINVNLSDCTVGLYFLQIEFEDGSIEVEKVVKL